MGVSNAAAAVFTAAICVMGKERGLKLIESMKDVVGLLVFQTATGQEETTMSKGFAKYLYSGK